MDVQLPKGSTLWSAYLDGKPTQPQREADSLLVELPAMPDARRRDLQLVYETPVNTLGMTSHLDLDAPKLLLRKKGSATSEPVPLADLVAVQHARWFQTRAERWNGVQQRHRRTRVAAEQRGSAVADFFRHYKATRGRSVRREVLRPDRKFNVHVRKPHDSGLPRRCKESGVVRPPQGSRQIGQYTGDGCRRSLKDKMEVCKPEPNPRILSRSERSQTPS